MAHVLYITVTDSATCARTRARCESLAHSLVWDTDILMLSLTALWTSLAISSKQPKLWSEFEVGQFWEGLTGNV